MRDHLEAADDLINGDRAVQHGDAEDLHGMIAALWDAFLREDPDMSPRRVTAGDVLLMMALLKIARTQHGAFNRDDYVDALGYIALAARLAEAANGKPTR